VTLRLGSTAVSWGLAQVGRTGYPGLCLFFVRSCFGVASRYPDARQAWEHVALSNRHTGAADKSHPPAGVPFHFSIPGSSHDHIVLSIGGGWCLSNDVVARGRIDRVRISLITQRWGAHPLGWAETINGVRVHEHGKSTVSRARVDASRVLEAARRDPHAGRGTHPSDVRLVERALVAEGLMDDRWVDGKWGSKTTAAWQRWQRRRGDHRATGVPGLVGLRALGARHGFSVHK
jgi:hypothetical protein